MRMLKVAPPTIIAIGQPSGANRDTVIFSPGRQPISSNFCFVGSSVKDSMMQLFPFAIFESFVTVLTIVKNGGFESVKIAVEDLKKK